MYIAYYDESGDDGYPAYSSPLFVLTAVYIHYLDWKETFSQIQAFRTYIKNHYGLPVKIELHTKNLLLDKNPYRTFHINIDNRVNIITEFCQLIANLPVSIINTVINKSKIYSDDYSVLENAFKYSIQRIENDLHANKPESRFMIITDEGRVGKMVKISRKIQKINFIPSIFGPETYRRDIRLLIEDPLPKNSQESYFIQIADLVSYIVYLYCLTKYELGNVPGRIREVITPAQLAEWLHILSAVLNLHASKSNEYGLVCYPK